mmetsp:Transcript_20978/g.18494  ORF Transcript_20978/g.18494 Transcript_20978/m.18494 type:complete len:276 (-) Transcript_20978:242-1069(-)
MEAGSTSMFASLIEAKTGLALDVSFKYTQFRFPFWGLVFYLLSIHLTAPKSNQPRSSQSKYVRKFGKTEAVMFIHNLVLAIFSLGTFINTAPILYNIVSEYGLYDGLCNRVEAAYTETSYGFWVHAFYLSKFYEFVDTWIVIARGRRPITLQVYHHCGAVIGLWLIMVAKASASFWFVVENSFIHTIMYSYYACSVVGIKFRYKFIITMLQMWQFIIGLSGSAWQLFYCSDCARIEEQIAIIYHLIYVSVLFYLFNEFYKKAYNKKKKKMIEKEE